LAEGDGDCDSDDDCQGSLVCGTDNCGDFRDSTGWSADHVATTWDMKDDCCMQPAIGTDNSCDCDVPYPCVDEDGTCHGLGSSDSYPDMDSILQHCNVDLGPSYSTQACIDGTLVSDLPSDDCDHGPCVNYGCWEGDDNDDKPRCQCKNGYSGPFCELPPDMDEADLRRCSCRSFQKIVDQNGKRVPPPTGRIMCQNRLRGPPHKHCNLATEPYYEGDGCPQQTCTFLRSLAYGR